MMLSMLWSLATQSSMTWHEECGGHHHGVATYLAFKCTRCTFEHCFCDPKSPASRVLNTRLVLGSQLCGLSRSGAYARCSMLDLPPLFSQPSYDAVGLKVHDALAEMADEQQKQTARNLKIALGKNPDDVVDVTVTYMVETRIHCSLWGSCSNIMDYWGSA